MRPLFESRTDKGKGLVPIIIRNRLGSWMELLGLGDETILSRLEVGRGHSYARLEPSGPDHGPRNTRWRLIVNIPEHQLLEWREH